MTDADLGRKMGISGSHVGQIIRREKSYSQPLVILLSHLEREADTDSSPAWLKPLGKESIESLKTFLLTRDEGSLRRFRIALQGLILAASEPVGRIGRGRSGR